MKGLVVFAITYVLVASQRLRFVRVDRPAGALIGAVLAVVIGASTPEEAAEAIDKSTLVLLFAVMGMGAFLAIDGFFDRAAPRLAHLARSKAGLLGTVVWGSGILSAIITNDAVCVLAAPVVVTWIKRWNLPRLPFLLALATAANTGSVATLVGNPQNMLCAHLGHLAFGSYLLHMAPVAILGLAINHGVLHLLFRKELGGSLPDEISHEPLFTPRSTLTVGILLGTVVLYSAGANLTFTALGGFATLLLVYRADPDRVWERIDWTVLTFFGALFVAVDAFARSGIANWFFDRVPLFAGSGLPGTLRTAGLFLFGSNVVTNVPFILVVRNEMARATNGVQAWELLAMAATFAGNLTLLGSVANVIVGEKAKSVGGLGFFEYMRAGVPIALLTTAMGAAWLVFMH
ncbi:MAG: SLC13 family permease [Polyangiaceae bacterium]